MSRFVSIGCRYYDLSDGRSTLDPIGEIVDKEYRYKVYSAECLLNDMETVSGVPIVLWPHDKKIEKKFRPYIEGYDGY